MRKVLIVGAGFAGSLHAEAWRSLGAEVRFHDPRLGMDDIEEGIEWADVVDFCDTPLSRTYYAVKYLRELSVKDAVFFEKPPVVVSGFGLEAWSRVVKLVNAVPVHNYVYMGHVVRRVAGRGSLKVVILRSAPHKRWYPTNLTGGGVLADHGYHWLYVAEEVAGIDLGSVTCCVDSRFDYVAWCSGGGFEGFFTWLSPVEATIVNGRSVKPPYGYEVQVRSLRELFRDEGRWGEHADASLKVLDVIRDAYRRGRVRPAGKEGPEPEELASLIPRDAVAFIRGWLNGFGPGA